MTNKGSGDLIKSFLIMAGIPFAFSVACSLFARIQEKRNLSLQDQIQETKFNSIRNDDEGVNHLKEQIVTLSCKIEDLQDLEREIEVRIYRLIKLKDQEYALLEVQNGLHVNKEQNKKFDEMVVEYVKALGDLESLRSENRVLRRREKKLLKKIKESLRLILKHRLKIETLEGDKLSKQGELKRKEVVIEGFEREVEEMRAIIDRLQNEKNELLNKFNITKDIINSKVEAERVLTKNYNGVANELEKIKKERASELKELIYLRWCHACLRHELARRKELEQETKHDEENIINHEPGFENTAPEECKRHRLDIGRVLHLDDPPYGPLQQHMKRRWLVRKFKKWVGGDDQKHQEAKCFGSHSCVDETEDQHLVERKSFSSL